MSAPVRLDAALLAYVEHFQNRCLQEALATATATFWERRATEFEAARPRMGDHHGKASRDELRERYDRLTAMAEACRNRAAVSLVDDSARELVEEVAA